jgi:hypothetical protein
MNDREQRAELIRAGLSRMGLYPTEQGVAMMEDPKEQDAARQGVIEALSELTPADLLAVRVLTASLTLH